MDGTEMPGSEAAEFEPPLSFEQVLDAIPRAVQFEHAASLLEVASVHPSIPKLLRKLAKFERDPAFIAGVGSAFFQLASRGMGY